MGEKAGKTRPISAHSLPIALSAPRPAPGFSRNRPAAAFVAQLLINRPATEIAHERRPDSRSSVANTAYRSTEVSDIKRVPMGYRKTMSA